MFQNIFNKNKAAFENDDQKLKLEKLISFVKFAMLHRFTAVVKIEQRIVDQLSKNFDYFLGFLKDHTVNLSADPDLFQKIKVIVISDRARILIIQNERILIDKLIHVNPADKIKSLEYWLISDGTNLYIIDAISNNLIDLSKSGGSII